MELFLDIYNNSKELPYVPTQKRKTRWSCQVNIVSPYRSLFFWTQINVTLNIVIHMHFFKFCKRNCDFAINIQINALINLPTTHSLSPPKKIKSAKYFDIDKLSVRTKPSLNRNLWKKFQKTIQQQPVEVLQPSTECLIK